jgi:hypothetical protein
MGTGLSRGLEFRWLKSKAILEVSFDLKLSLAIDTYPLAQARS